MLSLSPEGAALAVKIQACFDSMAREMAAPLSALERDRLVRLLNKLSDALTPPPQGNDA